MSGSSKVFTRAEVAKHNSPDDCWLIVDADVLKVTTFAKLHPGGAAFIHQFAGKDATEAFKYYHHQDVLRKYLPRLKVGTLSGEDYKPERRPIMMSKAGFGDQVPYGDPAWYQRLNSPYYKDTHRAFRARVRAFVDSEIIATLSEWEDKDEPPKALMKKLGSEGFLACMHGPPFPSADLCSPEIAAKAPKDFDFFHELILFDEIARCGHSAVVAAITNGCAIAMSAVSRFGSTAMKSRVGPPVFSGDKHICLAISEPNAGSDVAGLITTAKRDGDFFIVNGCKKWITNGTYADYFVTAVKTTEEGGHNGLSFLLLERGMEGLTTRKLAIRDSAISGTAFIEFVNVRVPVANLIGRENDGFKLIVHNFNHERMYISTIATRFCRVCIEDSIRFALRRKTFGKTLSEHQVIRMKIAAMARGTEQLNAWLESMAYQLCTMSPKEANLKLGDIICLLKAQCSKTLEFCARETTQIFGGNALHSTSVGKKIERMVGSVKGYQIPAGAEDIMDDFAGRTAFRLAQKTAKL